MNAPAAHSPRIWDLEHVDGREDVVALKDGRGDVIALLPIRRPERRSVFMGFSEQGGEDPIQERNLETIRLAPELLAELESLVNVTRIILGRMGELADASQKAATLIAKARGQ
jgi:hypothetical protein